MSRTRTRAQNWNNFCTWLRGRRAARPQRRSVLFSTCDAYTDKTEVPAGILAVISYWNAETSLWKKKELCRNTETETGFGYSVSRLLSGKVTDADHISVRSFSCSKHTRSLASEAKMSLPSLQLTTFLQSGQLEGWSLGIWERTTLWDNCMTSGQSLFPHLRPVQQAQSCLLALV